MNGRNYGNWRYLLKITVLILLLISGKSCETVREASDLEKPIVLLVSLDGFRFDYFDLAPTPVLDSLINSGVKAESLIPVFPSKTFPNHYTQVTGLYPEEHGIISNRMYDPDLKEYYHFGSNSSAKGEGKWYGGEPIWVTTRKQGLKSATMFWPGSDTEIQSIRPNFYFPFNGAIPEESRIEQVIEWMGLGKDRPQLITLYLELIDAAGHLHGPESDAMGAAIERIDYLLGQLMEAMTELGLSDMVDVIVVSDHGMAQLDRERVIFLDDHIDLGRVEVVNWSPVTELIPDSGYHEAIFNRLNGAHAHLAVYQKGTINEKWHFNHHPRITPIVAVADPGWSVTSSDYFESHPKAYSGGAHGYDPMEPSMHGILVASGPSFKAGERLESIESIHIYELLCELLGVIPAKNNGKLEIWKEVLQ